MTDRSPLDWAMREDSEQPRKPRQSHLILTRNVRSSLAAAVLWTALAITGWILVAAESHWFEVVGAILYTVNAVAYLNSAWLLRRRSR